MRKDEKNLYKDNADGAEREQLSIDCIAQHLKVFHEQAVFNRTADFGEPCSRCPHVMKECRLDWLTRMKPLFDRTNIQIGLDYLELPEDDNDWLIKKHQRIWHPPTEPTFLKQKVTHRGIRIDGVEYWDADLVNLNLGKTVIVEYTPWLVGVYLESGSLLHIFSR